MNGVELRLETKVNTSWPVQCWQLWWWCPLLGPLMASSPGSCTADRQSYSAGPKRHINKHGRKKDIKTIDKTKYSLISHQLCAYAHHFRSQLLWQFLNITVWMEVLNKTANTLQECYMQTVIQYCDLRISWVTWNYRKTSMQVCQKNHPRYTQSRSTVNINPTPALNNTVLVGV